MGITSKLLPIVLAVWLCGASAEAQTWDGVVAGKVSQIHATDGNNLGFRVYLDGAPVCGAQTPGWAYMNQSFDNYQVTAALIMTAWTMGRTVQLYTRRDASGWCRIGYVQVFS